MAEGKGGRNERKKQKEGKRFFFLGGGGGSEVERRERQWRIFYVCRVLTAHGPQGGGGACTHDAPLVDRWLTDTFTPLAPRAVSRNAIQGCLQLSLLPD